MALRTVGVRLAAEVSGYVNSLRTAKGATKDFVGELDRAAKAGNLDAVADQAGRMGLALTAGFGAVIAVGARFDKQMSSVSAATHASTQEMERLREAALQAGKDTAFSATEAAQGIEELSKAGVATADVLSGGLKGALDLAAAGQIGVGEAAETAASAMTQFGLSGAKVPHIADLLAAAAGKAQGGVQDMSQALNQSGLVAAQMGLSIEETTGTLAAFASAGLLGSDAGTSFKTMLLRLSAPTDVAAEKMRELGIRAFDAQGKFVGMEEFAGNLQSALGDLTDEQRNAALSIIFGTDAIRSSAIVYEQGRDGIEKWIKAVDEQGFAAETAAEKTDNLMGDIERLTGSLETLAIESSTGASSGMRTLVQAADNVVQSLSGFPAPLQNAAVLLAGLTGAVLLTTAGAIKMREATGRATAQLSQLGPVGERAARTLDKTSKVAGRAAAAFAILQVGGAVLGAVFHDELNPQIEAATGGLEEWNRQQKLAGEAARLFGGDAEDLSRALSATAVDGFSQFTDGVTDFILGIGGVTSPLDDAKERVSAFDQSLASMVRNGNAEEAGLLVAEMAKRANISIEEALKVLPTYAGEVENAARSGNKVAGAQKRAAETADILAGGWTEAAKEADGLRKAHDKLVGSLLGNIDAQIAFQEAIDVANVEIPELVGKLGAHEDAVTDDRTALDLNTDAGREVARMLRDLTDETITATQAKFDETKSVEEARKVYDEGRDALIRSMVQAGLTEAAAKSLADQWLKMPTVASTSVQTPGLDAAINKMGTLGARIKQLPSNVQVSVRGVVGFNREGGVWQHAQGGLLREPAVFTPRSPARFAFAEPATGGEAFIPRFGDRRQALSILGKAAAWHGAVVMPLDQMAAAQELLSHIRGGGQFFEDFSFTGMSSNLGRFNDRLAEQFRSSGQQFSRTAVEQFLSADQLARTIQFAGPRGSALYDVFRESDMSMRRAREILDIWRESQEGFNAMRGGFRAGAAGPVRIEVSWVGTTGRRLEEAFGAWFHQQLRAGNIRLAVREGGQVKVG